MEKIIISVGSNANMEPMLMSGDKVACIKTDLETLKFYGGYIHYVELVNGLTAIRRVYDEGNSIKIKYDGGDGGSQMIPKKYVQAIYRVIASARTY